MSTPEELDKILTECCERLVDCSAIITGMPFEPRKESIYKIGKALAEISDLRSEIYEKHPELKPAKWGQPPSDGDYDEMFQEAVAQANEYLDEGNIDKAIETYNTYIFIGPGKKHEAIAKEKINELRAKKSV